MKKRIMIIIAALLFITATAVCADGVRNSRVYHFNVKDVGEQTPVFLLAPGNYSISVTYRSDTDMSADVKASNSVMINIPMPATSGNNNTASGSFSLPYGTDRGKIRFGREQGAGYALEDISISSDRLLYTDYIFLYFVICILSVIFLCLYRHHRKTPFTENQLETAGMIALMIILSSIPWFFKDTYFELDTRAHMMRIEGVYEGLADHQLPVIIYPNYCNDFGELGILYPDLFLYFPAVLRKLGVSMMTSYRALMFSVCAAKVLVMYFSSLTVLKSRKAAMIASAVYIFEPYRMYNMYFRGSGAGSEIAGIFLPLVIAGVFSILFDEKKKWYLLALGMTGIMQSHILTLILTCIFAVFLVMVFIKDLCSKENLTALLKAVSLGILLNIGLLLPFMHYYFSDWDRGVLQWSNFFDELAGPYQMFFYDYSFFTLIIIAVNIIMFAVLKENRSKEHRIWISLFCIGCLFYLMSTFIFPWKLLVQIPAVHTFCNMLQTPRRFLTVATVLTAMVSGRNIAILSASGQRKGLIGTIYAVTAILCVSCTLYQYSRVIRSDVLSKDELTGDINSKIQLDYVPTGTTEDDIGSDAGQLSDENGVDSESYIKHGTHIDYIYSDAENGEYADLPLIYYEGYEASDQDGSRMKIEKNSRNEVRVYLESGPGEKAVHVRFRVRPVYTVFWLISAAAMACTLVILLRKYLGPLSRNKKR